MSGGIVYTYCKVAGFGLDEGSQGCALAISHPSLGADVGVLNISHQSVPTTNLAILLSSMREFVSCLTFHTWLAYRLYVDNPLRLSVECLYAMLHDMLHAHVAKSVTRYAGFPWWINMWWLKATLVWWRSMSVRYRVSGVKATRLIFVGWNLWSNLRGWT